MDGNRTPSEEVTWQFKPGETVSPRSQPPAPSASPQSAERPPVVAVPQATSLPDSPATNNEPEATQNQTAAVAPPAPAAAQFTPEPPQPDPEPMLEQAQPDESLTWTASEFIAHDKTAGWHAGLIGAAVVLAAALWLITKDWVTTGVVIFAGIVLSLYGARRPGEIQYSLDNYGLIIGNKQFNFADFRGFAIVPEGAFASIALLPTKRFAPMTTLYFAPEDGERIIDLLGSHLPQQPMKVDAIDSLMRKIRF